MVSRFSYDDAEALTDEIEKELQIHEEVLRIKDILENSEDEPISLLIDSLRRLELMALSVETLKATEIGKTVNVLRKHGSKDIRQLARTLIEVWKVLVDEWVNTTATDAGSPEGATPESVNPSTVVDEENRLPSPPLDDLTFSATQPTTKELSRFFDGLEDEEKYKEPWSNLSDKVVMVTGASSGLGRECCLDLAKAGCKVVAAARRIDRLRSLCDEINGSASDVRAVAIELDVSANSSAIEASVLKAWDAFGRIDALINNAGVRGSVHGPLDLTEEEWDDICNTNVKGTWLVSKHVCICMRDSKKGGSVINVSSIAGLNRGQLPGSLAYASSKTAVNAVTKIFALELGIHKIRVNSISPGLFKSEITQNLMQKDWLNNVALRTVPLRKWNSTDPALTSLIRYLVHDSSKYVSGNNFIVDAGATLPGVPIFSSL